MWTSSGSAAKCTSARFLNSNNGARGSRSSLYWRTALPPALARAGILQLDGGHRQPVHRQHHVERAVVAGMTRHLARHRQPVLAEQFQHLVVRAVGGLEVGEAKRLPVKLEAMPQHMERALGVQFLDQRGEQQRLQPRRVQRLASPPTASAACPAMKANTCAGNSARSLSHSALLPDFQPPRVSRISST